MSKQEYIISSISIAGRGSKLRSRARWWSQTDKPSRRHRLAFNPVSHGVSTTLPTLADCSNTSRSKIHATIGRAGDCAASVIDNMMTSLAAPSPASPARPPGRLTGRSSSADKALKRCSRAAPCADMTSSPRGQRKPRAVLGGASPVSTVACHSTCSKPLKPTADDVDMRSMTLWMQLWSIND
jgi:hypothetical protein